MEEMQKSRMSQGVTRRLEEDIPENAGWFETVGIALGDKVFGHLGMGARFNQN